jgi:hypothetical protein
VSPLGRFGLPDILKAKDDREARERFLRFMKEALQLVVGGADWIVGRQAVGGFWWTRIEPDRVRLPCPNETPMFLSATLEFTLEPNPRPERRGEKKVATRQYIFTISGPEPATPIFEWHWHPQDTPDRPDPHVHVTAEAAIGPLGDLHLPSWRVWFEDVVLFVIEDLQAGARPGAKEVLRDNRDRARRWASWK